MTEEELRGLLSRGESETLEFRATVPSARQIAECLASMANTEGGTLVLGVRSADRIRGVNPDKARVALDGARRYMRPALSAESDLITVGDRSVMLVTVPQTPHLVSASGGYYKRVGDRNRPLSAAEIRVHARTDDDEQQALIELSSALAMQTQVIDELRKDFAKVNSLLHKIGWVVGGAIAGAIAKHFAEILMFGR